jgi:DNA (cytosine-5)-methyltransferase 1
MKRKRSFLTLTDQFCGVGGSTLGAVRAGLTIQVAMNHWKLACEVYNANNPSVDPDCADVSATDPRRYPSTNILITSPECTNHSLAKGARRQYYTEDLFGKKLIKPEDERSRATMWDVPRFAEYHDYELIQVENVVDAAKWRLWDPWLDAMHALNYEHETVYFNSMFAHPTPQSRDRMYVVFWKKGNKKPDLEFRPKAYCGQCAKDVESIQTWKKRLKWGRYDKQYFYRCSVCSQKVIPYYYAAFNAIDFTVPSVRIGDRESLGKQPLRETTLERIRYGLKAWGDLMMITSPRYSTGTSSRIHNANKEPIPTQPGDASHAVVMPWLIETAHTQGNGKYAASSMSPTFTQTLAQTLAVLSSGFLDKTYSGNPKSNFVTMDEPIGTMVASGSHHALVTKEAFLSYYYGGSQQNSQIHEAVDTITGKSRVALVQNTGKLRVEDLYYRMLSPEEIGNAMAFPKEYKIFGTIKEKVKLWGNAVTPPVSEMIMERCIPTLR